jgi:hypothetical protein
VTLGGRLSLVSSSDGINFAFPENLIDNMFSNMILQQSISL